ncbi:hypothetical protein, partial [Neobacillus paridis]
MESMPSITFKEEKRMDGTTRYGSSSSSSSSFEFHTRREKPVATHGKPEQKQTDPDLDDWEFVPNDQVVSNQKRADPGD